MTGNRITQYLGPYIDPEHEAATAMAKIEQRHREPTETRLSDDLRKIVHSAIFWLGVGLIIGAFLAGLLLPMVCAVRVIEGK